jgi:hypothetical protein
VLFSKVLAKQMNLTLTPKELYAQIGKLKVENEFLKNSFKKLGG